MRTLLQVVYKGPPGHDAHDSFMLMMDNGTKVEVPCHALQPRSKVHVQQTSASWEAIECSPSVVTWQSILLATCT